MKQISEYYILTGGPGVGKTTLLKALEKESFPVVNETARTVIREQIAMNGDALPWENKTKYTDLLLNRSLNEYHTTRKKHPDSSVFFDRSGIDALCYASMIDYSPDHLIVNDILSCNYNKKVFILPPWREIYTTDSERKQSWEEALFTYQAMKDTYLKYGYTVIDVPVGSVATRKEFVLHQIQYENS